jgi:cohesin loading factor subunit SCC2
MHGCVCRLNADEQIQMVTALALQLIQCVVKLPTSPSDDGQQMQDSDDPNVKKKQAADFVCLLSYFC